MMLIIKTDKTGYKGFMKKRDFLLIGVFLIAAAVLWLVTKTATGGNTGGKVVVFKDGKVFATVPLTADETVIVEDENGNRNVIRVEGGEARMIEANCRDQVCVHTRPAGKDGQSIICLPNRVTVEIRSTQTNEIDGVSE